MLYFRFTWPRKNTRSLFLYFRSTGCKAKARWYDEITTLSYFRSEEVLLSFRGETSKNTKFQQSYFFVVFLSRESPGQNKKKWLLCHIIVFLSCAQQSESTTSASNSIMNSFCKSDYFLIWNLMFQNRKTEEYSPKGRLELKALISRQHY
jgi:hypothetical protein